MINNIKIWIGKNNPEFSEKVQKYLFSQDVRWYGYRGTSGKNVDFVEEPALFVRGNGFLAYGSNYDKRRFDGLKEYKEMKLIETVSYSLEEVKQREKICIGEKNYYLDELEVALKNIKPI